MMKRAAAAWRAGSALVSRFLATPLWRGTKFVADRVLLVAVFAAIGWTVVNGVYTAQRAATDRALALVHIGGAPTVKSPDAGRKSSTNVPPPTVVLEGTRSAQISIAITNDGVDGVSLKGGTLAGPYISGDVKLRPGSRTGYIGGHSTSTLLGTVTVDCNAAAPVSHALVIGHRSVQQPTTLTVSVNDTNGVTHSVALPVDNTALAVQGRVCTS
jgi:hypothetical protein